MFVRMILSIVLIVILMAIPACESEGPVSPGSHARIPSIGPSQRVDLVGEITTEAYLATNSHGEIVVNYLRNPGVSVIQHFDPGLVRSGRHQTVQTGLVTLSDSRLVRTITEVYEDYPDWNDWIRSVRFTVDGSWIDCFQVVGCFQKLVSCGIDCNRIRASDIHTYADEDFSILAESWTDYSPPRLGLARFNASGNRGAVATVVESSSWLGGVARHAEGHDGSNIVVWMGTGADGDGKGYGVFLRRFDSNLNALTQSQQVSPSAEGDQKFPEIAATNSGGFMIVWIDIVAGEEAVRGRLYSGDGVPGDDFLVSDSTTVGISSLCVRADGSTFLVAWKEQSANGYIGTGRFYENDGTPLTEALPITPGSINNLDGVVGLEKGYAILWRGLHDGAGEPGLFICEVKLFGTRFKGDS